MVAARARAWCRRRRCRSPGRTPAIDAPVTSSTPARKRKIARMCAPTLPTTVRDARVERLTERAAAGARASRHASRRARTAPCPRPSVPGGERSVSASSRQSAARAERAHGGQHRAQDEHGARRDERRSGRRRRRGRQPSCSPSTSSDAARAAVPAQIQRERDEDAGGEQREADQVVMALLEHRDAPLPRRRAASPRRAGVPALLGRLALGERRVVRAGDDAGMVVRLRPSTPRLGTLPSARASADA